METDIGQHIDSWMSVSNEELKFLHSLAKDMNHVVEIGSCNGRSTYALCSSGAKLVTAIDDFGMSPGTYFNFLENTKQFTNLRLFKMKSIEAAPYISDVDMVFIDGCHEFPEVMKDLETWDRKTSKILCGHDFRDDVTWTEVAKSVRTYFGREPDEIFESTWVIRK